MFSFNIRYSNMHLQPSNIQSILATSTMSMLLKVPFLYYRLQMGMWMCIGVGGGGRGGVCGCVCVCGCGCVYVYVYAHTRCVRCCFTVVVGKCQNKLQLRLDYFRYRACVMDITVTCHVSVSVMVSVRWSSSMVRYAYCLHFTIYTAPPPLAQNWYTTQIYP